MIFSIVTTAFIMAILIVNKQEKISIICLLLFANLLLLSFVSYNVFSKKEIITTFKNDTVEYQFKPINNWVFGIGDLSLYQSDTRTNKPIIIQIKQEIEF